MANTVSVKISAPLACFSRPELKVERGSYEVMTPSAARGVLDAILWKPQMRWVVQRIHVLKPIRFTSFRRNEIQSKVAVKGSQGVLAWMKDGKTWRPQPAGAGSSDATPRSTMALRDVSYIIDATPLVYEPTAEDHATKYVSMFNRRVAKGQCFTTPYLGCREFACSFEPVTGDEQPVPETRDLGLMLYDIVFRDNGRANRPVFFDAKLENGVLNCMPQTVLEEAAREEVLACSCKR